MKLALFLVMIKIIRYYYVIGNMSYISNPMLYARSINK